MTYCRHCGKPIGEEITVCPNCGGAQFVAKQEPKEENFLDTAHIGWGVLGFLIPLVGLVLYLVWREEKPKTAKVAGFGALLSVGLQLSVAIFGSLFFGLGLMGMVF